ncbi:MAG: ComF family protein [Candidatus Omnitrophota bacterium]|nr:ComF family protein [Candidatus Omnitrophota bacterium]
MLRTMLNLLYPSICRACSKKLGDFNRNICSECAGKIKERLPPFCLKCGKQIGEDPAPADICQDCRNNEPHFDRAWSACIYEGTLKNLIHDFKYNRITCLSADFASLMTGFMKKHGIGKDSQVIVSVPMHTSRLFRREINHSDVLASSLGKRLGIPYTGSALKKIKNTSEQNKLGRQERIKNLCSSFSIKNSSRILNKNILLVDDLFTTGSTVNECSKILKASGAGQIEVITLARGYSV